MYFRLRRPRYSQSAEKQNIVDGLMPIKNCIKDGLEIIYNGGRGGIGVGSGLGREMKSRLSVI